MTTPTLRTQDLAIGYRQPRRPADVVAEDISVSLHAGELVCLIGPNGVGKSTLLRTIAGMQPPLRGQVWLMGTPLADLTPRELATRLSIVLTERLDVGSLSAYMLVALGRYPYTDWMGALSPDDESVVRWAIEAVDAAHLASRNLSELSDGERQKIMIARALAQQPALMILDEPTAFLDLPNRVEVMRILRNLARATGRTVLLSTHDLDLALRSADRIWLLPNNGPLQVGAPEDLVLSGAFDTAFRSEGVHFDQLSGAFKIKTADSGQIAIIAQTGNEAHSFWTGRALERAGFRVSEDATTSALRVEIIAQNGHPCWQLTSDGLTHEYGSLHDLVSSLREHSQNAEVDSAAP